MISTHSNKEFEQELRTLRERLAGMGGRCEQQIQLADDLADALALGGGFLDGVHGAAL